MLPPWQPSAPAATAQWFATTHWSVVLAACDQRAPEAQAAWEVLCRSYCFPLRKEFGELLRQEIAGTVATEAEVDEEIRQLIRAASGL